MTALQVGGPWGGSLPDRSVLHTAVGTHGGLSAGAPEKMSVFLTDEEANSEEQSQQLSRRENKNILSLVPRGSDGVGRVAPLGRGSSFAVMPRNPWLEREAHSASPRSEWPLPPSTHVLPRSFARRRRCERSSSTGTWQTATCGGRREETLRQRSCASGESRRVSARVSDLPLG